MLATDFSNMTEGISQKKLQDLYEDIQTILIKDAKKKLENTKDVQTALKKGWEGEDRDIFIDNLEKLADKIVDVLNQYDEAIRACFQQVIDDWVDFQAKNVTAK